MRKFTMDDIYDWEYKHGEDFVDQNSNILPINIFLGVCFVKDYELFNILRDAYNEDLKKLGWSDLSLLNELLEPTEDGDMTVFEHIWSMLLHMVNTDDVYNQRFVDLFDKTDLSDD